MAVTQLNEFDNLFARFPSKQLRDLAARVPDDLAAILNALPVGVTVGNKSGMSFCNRRGLEMLGFKSVAALRHAAPLLADNTLPRPEQESMRLHPSEEPITLAFSSGRPATSEIVYRNRETGEDVTVQCTAIPIRDNEGTVALAAAVMTLQQTKSERDRAMLALGDALRRLSLHVRNTPLAVIEWRPDFRVASWSRRAEALFGWSEAEAKSMDPRSWQFTHEGDPSVGQASLGVLSVAGNDGSSVLRVRNYNKDGRVLHCEWYNSVLTDSEGRFTSVLSLVQDVTARVKAEEEKDAALKLQTDIAETLQRSLLLVPSAPHLPGVTLGHVYANARDDSYVGGDFYDTFALNNDRVALVLGDVTGKGVEAAAYTAEAKFALRAFLREHNDTGIALSRLNRFLLDSVRYDDSSRTAFAALSIVVFDSATRTLEASVAGAEPPILLRAKRGVWKSRALDIGGALLGLDPDAKYEVGCWPLEPGDMVCMTTDGVTEARRAAPGTTREGGVPDYEFFGMAGFQRTAEVAARSGMDLDEIGDMIVGAARTFAGGSLMDDVCLLVAAWQPPAG